MNEWFGQLGQGACGVCTLAYALPGTAAIVFFRSAGKTDWRVSRLNRGEQGGSHQSFRRNLVILP